MVLISRYKLLWPITFALLLLLLGLPAKAWSVKERLVLQNSTIVPPQVQSFRLSQFIVKDGELFFIKVDETNSKELWKSDGTAAGTIRIKTLLDKVSNSMPIVIAKHHLFFADNYEYGGVLWQSDGTVEGTTAFVASRTYGLANVNGTLFFGVPSTSNHSIELWKSDGTAEGTILVKEIGCGGTEFCASTIFDIVNVNGTAFFRVQIVTFTGGHTHPYFYELWKSDGTTQGTFFLKKFGATCWCSGYRPPDTLVELTPANNALFFVARENGDVNTLWRSDGTPEGTLSLTTPTATLAGVPTELTNVNGILFFSMNDNVNGTELWKSNGSSAGTNLVKDIWPGSFSAIPTELTAVDNRLFFSANDGSHGLELWQSDGTESGTELVKDILPGVDDASPQQLSNVNGTLVFSANDGQTGLKAWHSNGTAEETQIIPEIAPGIVYTHPQQFTFAGNQMFFTLNSDAGQELRSLQSFTYTIDSNGGKLTSWLDHIMYQFPSGTFSTTVTVTHTLHNPAKLTNLGQIAPIVKAFELTTINSETGEPIQPQLPYSLTIEYTPENLSAVNKLTMGLYYWKAPQWIKEESSMIDLPHQRIIATPNYTALWIVGSKLHQLFLPTIHN